MQKIQAPVDAKSFEDSLRMDVITKDHERSLDLDDTFIQTIAQASASDSMPVRNLHTPSLGESVKAVEDVDPERPPTTPVVARRLIHTHLDVKLKPEHRCEENSFWEANR